MTERTFCSSAETESSNAQPALRASDLRRFCIRRQVEVEFRLPDGRSVVVNAHGATVINGEVGCLLEESEFALATDFRIKSKSDSRPKIVSRRTLTHLVYSSAESGASERRQRPR